MQQSVSVLVLEDDFLIRDVIEQALIDAGFEVHVAAGGEEAIERLEEEKASYSALVSDVSLAGELTGWDVAKRARQLNPSLGIVYATANAGQWPAEGVPGSVLITKPFSPAQIVTAVAQLLNATTVPPPVP